MVGTDSSGSVLDAVADTVDERTVEAFEVLASETRLAILLALWEAKAPEQSLSDSSERAPPEEALAFSELYDRVEVPDSGQFNYHLDKLLGPFVEQTETGYLLTTRAERILRAVLAGTLADHSSFESEPIDADCFRCGSPTVIDYDEGILSVRCTSCEGMWRSPDDPSGTVIKVSRPPVGLTNRTPQEFFRTGNTWDRHRRFSMIEGVCPDCSGAVSTTVHVCDDHDTPAETVCEQCGSMFEIQSLFVCDVCKFAWRTPAWGPIFTEMAVNAFFYEHGLDHDALFDAFSYGVVQDTIEEVEMRSEEPQEVGVTVNIDGDRLHVTLDDEARVTDVTEEDSEPV